MSQELKSWPAAANLIGRWLGTGERIDRLMESLPPDLDPSERARCQYLVYGVVRHAGRIEAALEGLIAHPPRFPTRAALYLAGFELIQGLDPAAPIVHHAVEQTKRLASPAEARLVNAVGRRLAEALAAQAPPASLAPANALAEFFSHPVWLVRRWLALFGAESTRKLLEWNQQPAQVFARLRGHDAVIDAAGVNNRVMTPSLWPGFAEVAAGHWAEVEALLKKKHIYIQDPSTRIAIDLLAPNAGEAVLDLCAAPGGKALAIADRMRRVKRVAPNAPGEPSSRVIAVDLPGARLPRLRENLAGEQGVEFSVVSADIAVELHGRLRQEGLPETYPAVLLDAPCTNTGVMRHRPDVKWRLREEDFRTHARQQAGLLGAAATRVDLDGRLVYSTCSIDPEENAAVIEGFLKKFPGQFEVEETAVFFPWTAGHDGGAACRLRRVREPGPPRSGGSSSPSSRPKK